MLRSLGTQIYIEGYTIRSLSIAKPLKSSENGNHLKMAVFVLPERPCR